MKRKQGARNRKITACARRKKGGRRKFFSMEMFLLLVPFLREEHRVRPEY
jgi:hypothetical protein